MLTLFAIAKPFDGHIGVIQRALALFHRLDLRDATHLLTVGGVRRALDRKHLTRRVLSLPKFYLPATPGVRAVYRFWRRRVRGLPVQGGLAT